ncbi:toxin-antitoxin system YwqK family antitoxin [Cellulophaga tyrosinoxydans]|uniref:MORN repeat variant n=1 Tax=Cellulophaga tyrosinoxydans TaxID=504486 RepID=A0A1W2BKN5_9FLAO|nr:hypothetical protein [Cellulophaga tyrosinoxydans]SMC73212.1 MORN repeat variant [Cellulophaga tyrosinoxydans]
MQFVKSFLALFSVFLLAQCKERTLESTAVAKANTIEFNVTVIIDSVVVLKQDLLLNQLNGIWNYNNVPYNGYAVTYYPNGKIQEKLGFYKGKREGVAERWSEAGVLREERNFHQNKLVGNYKAWWENGGIAEESVYVDGLLDGEQKQWYPHGQLSKLRHLSKGNEDGMQKAWLKNGTLYVNYEAKNGRVFGLMRSNLCYELKNEVVTR